MKIPKLAYLLTNRSETLATFGKARLIKHLNGRITLEGGSVDDRRAAREWCSLFLHEAVIEVTTPRLQAAPPLDVGCWMLGVRC